MFYKYPIKYDEKLPEDAIIEVIFLDPYNSKATFFVKNNGTIYSCGSNENGLLGLGEEIKQISEPARINGINGKIKSIYADADRIVIFVLTENNNLYSWGCDKFKNRLGTGKEIQFIPEMLGNIEGDIKDFFSYRGAVIVLTEENSLYVWGEKIKFHQKIKNINDEILTFIYPENHSYLRIFTKNGGVYDLKDDKAEFKFNIGAKIKSIKYNNEHDTFFAITEDNKIFSWGHNYWGQLGLGDRTENLPILKIEGVNEKITNIKTSNFSAFALTESGKLYAWGENNYHCLGVGDEEKRTHPTLIENINGKIRKFYVAKENQYSNPCNCIDGVFAITEEDDVYCWGSNTGGFLGIKDKDKILSPEIIKGIEGKIRYFFTAKDKVFLSTEDGKFYTWGGGKSSPIQMALKDVKVKDYYIADYYGFFITEGGDLYFWGQDDYNFVNKEKKYVPFEFPVKISGIEGKITSIKSISTYYGNVFAITDDGVLYSWGRNQHTTLGIGSFNSSAIPCKVTGIKGKVKKVINGYESCFALTEEGNIYVWGNNEHSKFGLEDMEYILTPMLLDYFDGKVTDIFSIASKGTNIFAFTDKGSFYVWGSGDWGHYKLPYKIPDIAEIKNFYKYNGYILFHTIDNDLFFISRYNCDREIFPKFLINFNSRIKHESKGYILTEEGEVYKINIKPKYEENNRIVHIPFEEKIEKITIGYYDKYIFALSKSGVLYSGGDNLGGVLGRNTGIHKMPSEIIFE